MCWAFSRDGAVPGHQLWSKVNSVTGTPINAMLFMVILAFILGLPMLNSTVAFGAVISISTIGLYISCAHMHSLSFVTMEIAVGSQTSLQLKPEAKPTTDLFSFVQFFSTCMA
jgi:amino acid transporter